MKFLWLNQNLSFDKKNPAKNKKSLKFMCVVHQEMKEIDDMWHTFILFTKDYTDFCQHYSGDYIHHTPADEEDESISNEQYKKELTHFLTYIYDHLGESTVKKWFNES